MFTVLHKPRHGTTWVAQLCSRLQAQWKCGSIMETPHPSGSGFTQHMTSKSFYPAHELYGYPSVEVCSYTWLLVSTRGDLEMVLFSNYCVLTYNIIKIYTSKVIKRNHGINKDDIFCRLRLLLGWVTSWMAAVCRWFQSTVLFETEAHQPLTQRSDTQEMPIIV